jgi:putative inorganic carbon (hco3(-)) transporter
MIPADYIVPRARETGPWIPAAGLVAAGVLLVFLVREMDAALAVGAALAALGGFALVLAVPMVGVALGIFLIFANVPAVASQQGILPEVAAAVVVGMLFVPALVRELVARRRRLRLGPIFALMTALLAMKLVSSYFAVDVPLALGHTATYAMEGMVIFLLVVNTVRDRPALVRTLKVLVGAAALLATFTVYQSATGNFHHEFGGLAQRSLEHLDGERRAITRPTDMGLEHRSRGPVDDPNRYAQVLLIAGAFALALFWNSTGRRRAVFLGAGGLVFAAVLLTYSRGAFLTLVLLVLALGALRYLPPRRLALVLVAGILLVPVVAPGYVDRIHTIAGAVGLVSAEATTVEPDGPTRGRTTQMLAAILAFSEHPFIGVGPGQYTPHHSVRYQLRPEIAFRELPTPRRAHNLVFEVAAEGGAVGLLLFLAIPGLLIRNLWRIRRQAKAARLPRVEHLAVGFLLAILSYLGTGMFLHLAYQRYYWLLVGLSAAAVWILGRELEERSTPDWGFGEDEDMNPYPEPASRPGFHDHLLTGGELR